MVNKPMIETQNLNLARKWRPQTFEHVVGQDIAIRMLKNSLYLDKFFPVYLFAGQRGCGKTSTARIFAAAINCAQRTAFQQNPTLVIPCLTCPSCTAMLGGNHPDFIEIDAASHTGVDNVRQIIDASSYMPLIGQKKIYLIDEAHMLSKAAFNAFLKILEEPPVTVHFILATTETPKIPATVLSRCFQVIFNPIQSPDLHAHLTAVCAKENITIDQAAIDMILDETEGSARDAINLLERIRFSGTHITEQTVLDVLGKISHKDLFTLFQLIIGQKAHELLLHLQTINFQQRSPQLLWDMLIHVCRSLVWIKYGVTQKQNAHAAELQQLAQACSLGRLNAIMSLLWTQEEIFLKTNKKHLFLEMVLLQLCQQVDIADLQELVNACKTGTLAQQSAPAPEPAHSASPAADATPTQGKAAASESSATQQPTLQAAPAPQQPLLRPGGYGGQATAQNLTPWTSFLQSLAQANDPFLHSIFTQATFVKEDNKQICVQLNTNSMFFKNKIEETKNIWQPVLESAFPGNTGLMFLTAPQQALIPQPPTVQPIATPRPPLPQTRPQPPPARPSGQETEYLAIKNADQWPQTALLLSYFPGKIKKIKTEGI